jgi:hypothetical protein
MVHVASRDDVFFCLQMDVEVPASSDLCRTVVPSLVN